VVWQRILVVALAPYVAWLVVAYEYHFLDGVNLLFHEAGHLFFGLFGRTLHFLGGSLAQLFFPAACVFHFLRQEKPFEAAVCGIWLSESAMYMAHYMADAKAMALPLVGGHIHDWNWLLGRAGLLEHCVGLGRSCHVLASAGALASLTLAARLAFGARRQAGDLGTTRIATDL